jgi:hypothetical protein
MKKIMWYSNIEKWDNLEAASNPSRVPEFIDLIIHAKTEEEAEEYYWGIDNTVILQGTLYESAVPTLYLVLEKIRCSELPGRNYLIQFIEQVALSENYESKIKKEDFKNQCLSMIKNNKNYFYEIFDFGLLIEKTCSFFILCKCAIYEYDVIFFEEFIKKYENLCTSDSEFIFYNEIESGVLYDVKLFYNDLLQSEETNLA